MKIDFNGMSSSNRLRDAAAMLAIIGVTGLAVYGVSQIRSKKPDITVTDPQKAEQDIKTESDASRAFFEATQNIQAEKTTEVQEEVVVPDISELCRNIAEYKRMNDEAIDALKSGRKADADFRMSTIEQKEQEIRNAFVKAGYKQPSTPRYIDNLGDEFEKYVQKAKADINALK